MRRWHELDYIGRIKQIKSEKKITNDKLSELTGIPLGTLSKLLAGISDSPKLSNIVAIAGALGCSLDYLVSGVPENHNNFTLSDDEIRIIENYRALDAHGRDIVDCIIAKEYERIAPAAESKKAVIIKNPGMTLRRPAVQGMSRRNIVIYDLPVSAGPGIYLDDTSTEEINIPDNEKTASADFALRISGNSMEPKYHNGDVLLVEKSNDIEEGDLGIFILDGNGYFKKFGGDRLISLNPEYDDIMLHDFSDVVCCGKVIGRLKRKSV